jgi:hypothetical protein
MELNVFMVLLLLILDRSQIDSSKIANMSLSGMLQKNYMKSQKKESKSTNIMKTRLEFPWSGGRDVLKTKLNNRDSIKCIQIK